MLVARRSSPHAGLSIHHHSHYMYLCSVAPRMLTVVVEFPPLRVGVIDHHDRVWSTLQRTRKFGEACVVSVLEFGERVGKR